MRERASNRVMKTTMRTRISTFGLAMTAMVLTITGLALSVAGQVKDRGKPDSSEMIQLRIEVTGGEKSSPVDMASVYVRFIVKHTLGKDEKIEMNIKTNREGIAIAPAVQKGKVLVQVVADGWKPFGNWFDVTDDGQVVKVKMERPPKWY
jgi:hypothetical protein